MHLISWCNFPMGNGDSGAVVKACHRLRLYCRECHSDQQAVATVTAAVAAALTGNAAKMLAGSRGGGSTQAPTEEAEKSQQGNAAASPLCPARGLGGQALHEKVEAKHLLTTAVYSLIDHHNTA